MSVLFDTRVNGIPCLCEVLQYKPAVPALQYGPEPNDVHPPEVTVFDFQILDRRSRKAPWLAKYLTEQDSLRLLEEYEIIRLGDYFSGQ